LPKWRTCAGAPSARFPTRALRITSFARDVLASPTTCTRAGKPSAPKLRKKADTKVKALIEGVETTERELLKSWKKTA